MINFEEERKRLREHIKQQNYHCLKIVEIREKLHDYGYARAECTGVYEDGILRLTIKGETLPHTKMMGRDIYNSGYIELHRKYQSKWNEIIKKAKENAIENSQEPLRSFNRAIIHTVITEKDTRLRDCDNYPFYVLHNALKNNEIIVDDNFKRMQFAYSIKGTSGGKEKSTQIMILNNDQSWVKTSCSGCPINEIYTQI